MSHRQQLLEKFGEIDIYLFDQILKGRFDTRTRILDAGCGAGRNLYWFLQNGFQVHAVDREETVVNRVRTLANRFAPGLPDENFRVAEVEDLPFEDDAFDAVVCSAVLHFAENTAQFNAMRDELWRVLRPGGLLFVRLASTIGLPASAVATGDGRYRLPDGTERYLVSEEDLVAFTEKTGASQLDPIKTTNVQNLRCMTTWCLQK